MGAVIAAEQTGSDADQMGLSFYTHLNQYWFQFRKGSYY